MKVTIRDKILIFVLLISAVIYIGVSFIYFPLDIKSAELRKSRDDAKSQISDITPLIAEKNNLTDKILTFDNRLNDISLENSLTLNEDEFLLYIGKCSSKNNVRIIRFKSIDKTTDDKMTKEAFDFEIRGKLANINKVIGALDKIGIKYSVGSLSLRSSGESEYLKRDFDNSTNMPWYVFNTEHIENPLIGDMRLALTVCFYMSHAPNDETSFLDRTEG